MSILPRAAICYDNLREGAEIIEKLCTDAPGSTSSRDLAAALGVRPWDFDTHAFDPHRVDTRAFEAHLGTVWIDEPSELIVRRFVALRDAGFEFYFRPDG